jgi:hypothetical protein
MLYEKVFDWLKPTDIKIKYTMHGYLVNAGMMDLL